MVPSSGVSATIQFAPAAYGLAAVAAWGTSDFLGGYATRRANAFVFASVVNGGGLLLMIALAATHAAQFPSERSLLWALAGGSAGGGALALFYRALSMGKMGLTAPIAAVLSAAIPTLFGIFTEGRPGIITVFGFAFAVFGIWLITRPEEEGLPGKDGESIETEAARPKGIGLAVIAGIGFAAFYLCIRQAGDASVFWIATFTRTGGFLITALIVLAQRRFRDITPAGIGWGVLAGWIDSLGTILFVLASQAGRLDKAVVISSLYPTVTVILARLVLKEHFTRWKFVGLLAALAAVPMIAAG